MRKDKYTVTVTNNATGETIPSDEPVFIIRAKDRYAPTAVSRYADILAKNGDDAGAEDVRSFAMLLVRWQEANPDKVKTPD